MKNSNTNSNTRREDIPNIKSIFGDSFYIAIMIAAVCILAWTIVTSLLQMRGSGYVDDVIISLVEQIDGRLPEDSNQDIYKFLLEEIGVEGKRVGDGLEVPLGYRDYTCVVKCESYSDTVVLSTSYFSDNVKSAVIDRETGEVEYSWE